MEIIEKKVNAWVARDSNYNGDLLNLFYTKPVKLRYSWEINNEDRLSCRETEKRRLNTVDFSQVKWEDEEPTEVELIIKIK